MTPRTLAAAGLRYDVDGAGRHGHARPARGAQRPDAGDVAGARRDRRGDLPDDVRVVVVRGSGHGVLRGPRPRDARPRRRRRRGDGGRAARASTTRRSRRRSTTTSRASPGCATRGSSRSRRCRATPSAPASSWRSPATCGCVADDAQFCMKESALGLVPDLTGTKPLVEALATPGHWRSARPRGWSAPPRPSSIGLATDRRTRRRAGRARSPTWSAALTAPLAGAVRETKALLLGRRRPDLDEQRRLEREAQIRRFRELAAR